MKPPKRFHTGAITWTISFSSVEWAKACVAANVHPSAYGLTDKMKQRIFINPDSADQTRRTTLVHEALHAVCTKGNVDPCGVRLEDLEEVVVTALEPCLFDALADPRNQPFWEYICRDPA